VIVSQSSHLIIFGGLRGSSISSQDPEEDPTPGVPDAEEYIKIESHMPLKKVKELVLKGKVALPTVQVFFFSRLFLNSQ
jgi:hypothetical protein